MKLKNYKSTSNSIRHKISLKKNDLSKNNKLVKFLSIKRKQFAGRSKYNGQITCWHKGGSKKKLYRKLYSLNQTKNSIVININYDPYRKSFISLNFDLDLKSFFYSISNNLIYSGSLIKSSKNINELKLGFRTSLNSIPTGSIISNLSVKTYKSAQYIKSAGTYGQIIQKDKNFAKIKLPSKKIIDISTNSFANIGIISNLKNNQIIIGNAGTNRNLGIRPTVRGIAMNPIDHPHGGRTNGGRPSVTPWGLPTKGKFKLKKKKL